MDIKTDYGYMSTIPQLIAKHIENTWSFQNTSNVEENAIKELTADICSNGMLLPFETLEWLPSVIRYIADKQGWLVFNYETGLWDFSFNDSQVQHILVDYFEILKQFSYQTGDRITRNYANYCVKPTQRNSIVALLKDSKYVTIDKADEIEENNFMIRCFKTTDGRLMIVNLNDDKFKYAIETPDSIYKKGYIITKQLPHEIALTNYQEPTHFLNAIDTYMQNDPEKIEYFKKMLAYIVAPYNYNQCFIYWLGMKGRNGKSTMLKVLQDLLGKHVGRLNSDMLDAKDKTAKVDDMLANAEGKSLLMFNEIDERIVASTKAIKDLTEGGRDAYGGRVYTFVRPAYSRGYEVCVSGTPLIVANNLINMGSWANLAPIFKRLVLVSFDYVIQKEDPDFLNVLASEYPHIQMWLYKNYFKYKGIKLKDEPLPQDWQVLKDNYRADSDILGTFFKVCFEITGNDHDHINRSELYKMYENFCAKNGKKPVGNLGSNGFSKLITPYIKDLGTGKTEGMVTLKGIKVSSVYENEIDRY